MLYERIKARCTEMGVSIAEVERQAGLSNGSISKWGKSMPQVDRLNAVAKVLGTTIGALLGEKE